MLLDIDDTVVRSADSMLILGLLEYFYANWELQQYTLCSSVAISAMLSPDPIFSCPYRALIVTLTCYYSCINYCEVASSPCITSTGI